MNNGNEDTKLKLKVLDDLQSKDDQIDRLSEMVSNLETILKQKNDRIRELEQINKEHQDLNGKLREEIKSIEIGTVNNFRRKGVL